MSGSTLPALHGAHPLNDTHPYAGEQLAAPRFPGPLAPAHPRALPNPCYMPAHSCAAPAGEELVGARAYRVIFALVSLPLAIAAVVYFIDHRYDGVPLWNVR